jgi:hypothetical protein
MRETAKQRTTRIRLGSARKPRPINSPRGEFERDGDRFVRATPSEQDYVKKESVVAVPL